MTYQEEKALAEVVDRKLQFDTARVESAIQQRLGKCAGKDLDREFWVGLSPQSLSTPYTEILRILLMLDPKPGETVVDLGASYGRIGHVLNEHYSGVRFIGFEFVHERVVEGERVFALNGVKNARLEQADLAAVEFIPPRADYYFIYDFGSRTDIKKCLSDLRVLAASQRLTVVGRGGRVRDLIEKEHAWLANVVAPEHCGRFSIYRS